MSTVSAAVASGMCTHRVAELLQLVDGRRRQHVRPDGERLAGLDEGWSEVGQAATQLASSQRVPSVPLRLGLARNSAAQRVAKHHRSERRDVSDDLSQPRQAAARVRAPHGSKRLRVVRGRQL